MQFAPGGDETKRAFTYFVLTGGRFIGAAAVRLAVLKFVLSMTVGAAAGPEWEKEWACVRGKSGCVYGAICARMGVL